MNDYAVEMLHITKEFPGIIANDDITLQIKKGEIHALLGENGAGKSTLMNVLFGMYRPEKGEIHVNGKRVEIKNPNDANDLGIGMVHQHFKLVECFTVLENIILGNEPAKRGFLDLEKARKKVMRLSEQYHLQIVPDAVVEDITVGMQQRTEILKMLYRDNDILIFDEPTAMLTAQEIQELLKIMKGLAAEGKSILFITHKLNEIMAVADRCSILRKGKYTGTVKIAETNEAALSALMVGRNVNFKVDKVPQEKGDVILAVEKLVVAGNTPGKNAVNGLSLTLHEGEILCIAGIDGNGQRELIYALTGLTKAASGVIRFKGEDITKASVRRRSDAGMAHIPEDRHKHGLVLNYTLEDNMVLTAYHQPQYVASSGILKRNVIHRYAEKLIEAHDVRCGQGCDTIVKSMSGGNQQKAIFARELDRNPDVLIAVQPTRGVDVGAIEVIHRQLVNERNKGKGILMVSMELDEVMDLADRILVIFEGRIVGEFKPEETTMENLGLYMTGARRIG